MNIELTPEELQLIISKRQAEQKAIEAQKSTEDKQYEKQLSDYIKTAEIRCTNINRQNALVQRALTELQSLSTLNFWIKKGERFILKSDYIKEENLLTVPGLDYLKLNDDTIDLDIVNDKIKYRSYISLGFKSYIAKTFVTKLETYFAEKLQKSLDHASCKKHCKALIEKWQSQFTFQDDVKFSYDHYTDNSDYIKYQIKIAFPNGDYININVYSDGSHTVVHQYKKTKPTTDQIIASFL